MSAFGLPAEHAEEIAAARVGADFRVFAENWDTVLLFLVCATQWRSTGHGATGLDYAAVEAVMRIHDVQQPRETFDGVRIMESAALTQMNRKNP